MKEWAQLLLNCLGEAMQHTENRIEYEISTAFAGTIGQFLKRIYLRMCTELFGAPFADANKDDYVLPDTLIAAYDPTKWFTMTELVDTVPPLWLIPTEDDLTVLRAGIPANVAIGLSRYPRGGDPNVISNPTVGTMGVLHGGGSGGSGSSGSGGPASTPPSGGSFSPPPGP